MVDLQEKLQEDIPANVESAKKIGTDEALMALPGDGNRYELVDGELITIGNAGTRHGYYASLIYIMMGSYVRIQKLGFTFDSDTAFAM